MKAAIISLNGASSKNIGDELKKYFDVVDMLDIRKIDVTVGSGGDILYCGEKLSSYDCVLIRGSYKYALIQNTIAQKLYGKCYMPLSPTTFTTVHDKILTHIELEKYSIPMPKTYVSATPDAAKLLLKNVIFPIMMKLPHGAQGKGVMFSDSYASAVSMLDTLNTLKQPFLIQEYIETNGSDIRAIVVGDVVVAAMMRVSAAGDKRSNLHSGGSAQKYDLTSDIIKLALKTAQAVGAEICGVDILQGIRPVVIEANVSPGLQGITRATNINVAEHIARFLALKTQEFLQKTNSLNSAQLLIKEQKLSNPSSTNQQIIAKLDFRGARVLLPQVICDVAKLRENQDYSIDFKEDSISLKKL